MSSLQDYVRPCREPAPLRHDWLKVEGLIKVMSHCMRYCFPNASDSHWNIRILFALAKIQALKPDLLGLQEYRDNTQADFVRTSLPHLQFLGILRQGSGDTASKVATLLFRRSAFELLDKRVFLPERDAGSSWMTTP